MRLSVVVLGATALVGVGYVLGKKIIDRKNTEKEDIEDFEEPKVYVKKNYSEALRKASMAAVGVIRTSADKAAETFKDITSKDMVKRGEETVEAAKAATENIKRDLEDFKDRVVPGKDDAESAEDLFESSETDSIFDTPEENSEDL